MNKIINFFDRADRHEVFVMSAALAYTTALALAPFLLITLSMISILNLDIQQRFASELSGSVGPQAGEAIQAIMNNVNDQPRLSGLSGTIGFIILLISASAIFSQLRIALDKINEYVLPESLNNFKSFLKNKILSFGLVLGFAFLSIVSMVVTALIALILPSDEAVFWQAIAAGINFILFALLFTTLFHFVPSERHDWKKCFFSGCVSTVFYLIGKSLIGLYLSKAGIGSLYGAAGSLIVFLVWVYYTSLTLLLSYELSVQLFVRKGSRQNQDIGNPPVSANTAPVT